MKGLRRASSWVVIIALGGTLATTAFWLLFTTFMIYDDEGYVLLSLKNFSNQGFLYDKVYTQYGPFFYLFYDTLHRLIGFSFTNTTGRWVTLVNWVGVAAICAVLVGRQTRSLLWTTFTFAGVFTYLWVMINEPIHPGGTLSLLIALGAWLGVETWSEGHPNRFAVITALIGAALTLTKVNVGVFYIGAVISWLAVNTASRRAARVLTWIVALGVAALPLVLMRSLMDAPWVRLFGLLFTGAALSTILASRITPARAVSPKTWSWFAGTFTGTVVVIGLITLSRGTSLSGLVNGVVLEPLKHPGVYFFPMNWRAGANFLALISLIASFTITCFFTNGGTRLRLIIAVARLASAGIFLCSPLQIIPTSLAAWGMCYGVTLAWLFALPLSNDRSAAARCWIALLLVFQFLHAYPVAGSQINWGTFLWIPLLALGLHDAAPIIFKSWPRVSRPLQVGGGAVAFVTLTMVYQLAATGYQRYYSSQPLDLPGAENIRVPNDTTYALRIVHENLQAHANMLFSFPGLYSANLWTALPTPTLANATHWFSLLSAQQQMDIIRQLDRHSRAAVLIQRDVLNYLEKWQFATQGVLYEWIHREFEPALKIDGYEIWLRRGRTVAAYSTANLTESPTGPGLTITLSGTHRTVATMELADLNAPQLPLVKVNTATPFLIEPITPDGAADGAPSTQTVPLNLDRPVRIRVRLPSSTPLPPRGRGLVVLRDASGRVVTEARIVK